VLDRIDLDLVSTGFDVYLHPQAVLLNQLNITFNTGVELLNLIDHAADTTVTTAPNSGFSTLLVKSGVTVKSFTGGPIELLALLVLTVLGLTNFHVDRVGQLFGSWVVGGTGGALSPVAFGVILTATAVGVFAYNGYSNAVNFSEETQGSSRSSFVVTRAA